MDLTELTQDRDRWRELVHAVMNQSFISPTNAQPICFKILKFILKFTTNAPMCCGLTKPSSGSLQSVLR
jgi:hypothetical protein